MRGWELDVQHILLTGRPRRCDAAVIVAFTLGLLNHTIDIDISRWVASSFNGQVVFPSIFKENRLQKEGYLQLYCLPGALDPSKHEVQKPIQLVRSLATLTMTYDNDPFSTDITKVVNLYGDFHIQWNDVFRPEGMFLGMSWTKSQTRLTPFEIFRALSCALFKTCSHDQTTPLDEPSPEWCLQTPVDNGPKFGRGENFIFPVANDHGLRLLSLTSMAGRLKEGTKVPLVVINQGACLKCLFECCRLYDCRLLVF